MRHVLSNSETIPKDALLFRLKDDYIPAFQEWLERYPIVARETIDWLEKNNYWSRTPYIMASDITNVVGVDLGQLYKVFKDEC
tara:strand:- start:384 stop:632 length:249 start_codon:yes stop_codon:yes gene_type:complete